MPRPVNGYTDQQYLEARERILNKTIAYGILIRADRGCHGKLIEEVENAFLKGNNDYPTTPTEAYDLLVNYQNYSSNKRPNTQGGLDQVAFITEGKRLKKERNSHILNVSNVINLAIIRVIVLKGKMRCVRLYQKQLS